MSKRSSLSMYVIATVFCSNFHFSVSLHVPFSQFLFERDSYSNKYSLAKIGIDTAENEPLKVHLIFKLWDLIFTEPPQPLLGAPGCARSFAAKRTGIPSRLRHVWHGDHRRRLHDGHLSTAAVSCGLQALACPEKLAKPLVHKRRVSTAP